MKVSLHKSFSDQLNKLARDLEQWSEDGRKRLVTAHKQIGQRHKSEAVKRIPTDEGRVRNSIITRTHVDAAGTQVETETGTNVKEYPVYLEFGTKYIAGGDVLRLGGQVGITDAQAVHTWPAKRGEATSKTSAMHTTDRLGRERLRNASGQFLNARPQEQMPWLRPAFSAIREWAIRQIDAAFAPPKQ